MTNPQKHSQLVQRDSLEIIIKIMESMQNKYTAANELE